MGIIKIVLNKYKEMKDPVGYAKSIGVNVSGGVIFSRVITGAANHG